MCKFAYYLVVELVLYGVHPLVERVLHILEGIGILDAVTRLADLFTDILKLVADLSVRLRFLDVLTDLTDLSTGGVEAGLNRIFGLVKGVLHAVRPAGNIVTVRHRRPLGHVAPDLKHYHYPQYTRYTGRGL